MKNKPDFRISVRLDPETQQRLDEEIQATGKKESEVVREALVAYLRKRPKPESCLELARRHRLIGCGKRLPSDLSTNRRHFEGFGR
ncbi:MAG: CopG family transcriptional regulator [Planctomycetes bacterium]|nr:CopG family transcriptional regulator [Planctomycetota bacterium]